MTDKQIIINSIDVSECEFYNKDDKTCREVNGKYDTDICEFDKCENSDCYYKQLKRKEQELKLAENHIKDLDLMVFNGEERENELEQKLKAKEQECEEKQKTAQDTISKLCVEKSALYNELDKLKAEFDKKELIFAGIETSNRLLIEKIEKIKKQKEKLKQTITEIKEIVEKHKATAHCDYLIDMDKILQKISECEVK